MSRQASGLKAWVFQRVSAVYIAMFFVYLLSKFAFAAPANPKEWIQWWGNPVINIAALLFVIALMLHAWIGVRDIVIDYVWNTRARLSVLTLVAIGLIICALWAAELLILVRTI